MSQLSLCLVCLECEMMQIKFPGAFELASLSALSVDPSSVDPGKSQPKIMSVQTGEEGFRRRPGKPFPEHVCAVLAMSTQAPLNQRSV